MADKKIGGPKMGPIRAKKGPIWCFRPFSCSKYSFFASVANYSQRQLRSGLVLSVRSWSVRDQFSWKTGHGIFPIFRMDVPYYKGEKHTRRFSREKCESFKNLRCKAKNNHFSTLSGFWRKSCPMMYSLRNFSVYIENKVLVQSIDFGSFSGADIAYFDS